MQTVDRDAVPSPGELGDQTHLRTGAVVGNYLFEPDVLAAALSESSRLGDTDFGTHLLPRLLCTHRVVAYDFARNRVPGVQPYEEPACWRDVGTIEAYRGCTPRCGRTYTALQSVE